MLYSNIDSFYVTCCIACLHWQVSVVGVTIHTIHIRLS